MEKDTVKLIAKNTLNFTNLWGVILPLQALGIFSIYNIVVGGAPDWWWISFIIGYVCIKMLGVSAGYHRLFSHKSFQTSPLIKKILLYFGMLSGQGSPIFWIGIHRGYHHRHADKDLDAHSPQHGFWHSYILWMFKRSKMSIRSVIDLTKDKDMVFCHKNYIKIVWATHLVLILIDINLWLYLLVLPSFIALHSFLLQTSVTHLSWAGYRNYKTDDHSVNSPWLWPLILGEAWHNNHHGDGRNPNFGRKYWELDPTFWLIKLIKSR